MAKSSSSVPLEMYISRGFLLPSLSGVVFLLLTGYSFVYSMLHNSQGTVPYRFFWQ
jgi:hypothetical protein